MTPETCGSLGVEKDKKGVWRPRRVELEGAEGDARDWLIETNRPIVSCPVLHNLNNSKRTTVRSHLGTLYNGMGIPLLTGEPPSRQIVLLPDTTP